MLNSNKKQASRQHEPWVLTNQMACHYGNGDINQPKCVCVCVHACLYGFHVVILQGAQEPLVSLAPTKTLIIGCVNVPAGTPWAPLCAAWVPIRTSIFNPVSLAHRLSDAFDAITNGQQKLKNEMSNMTSQVCSRRRDLSVPS